jgi:hypothetical protein
MKATITDHNINLEGFKYFVGKASDVSFGAWGDKKTPWGPGKVNYLDVSSVIPSAKLSEVKLLVTPLEVEFSDSSGIDLFANATIPGLAKGNGGVTIGDFSKGKVKLLKISPDGENGLIKQINNSPAVIKGLIDLGGGARVVEDVLIAVEATLYDNFSAKLTAKGAVIVDDVLVQAEFAAGWDQNSVVQLEPGTTVGYSLAEPKWDAHQDKNKTQVTDLRDDEQGL